MRLWGTSPYFYNQGTLGQGEAEKYLDKMRYLDDER